MTKISGIFAATMSVLNSDLSLNVDKTIEHAEKLIDQGCHGTAIFGSTGQSQLISISEKIDLLNQLSKSKYKNNHLIGTGLNSLGETINFGTTPIRESLIFLNKIKNIINIPAITNPSVKIWDLNKLWSKLLNNIRTPPNLYSSFLSPNLFSKS